MKKMIKIKMKYLIQVWKILINFKKKMMNMILMNY